MTVDEAEQKLIMATLESAGGNKTRAAEMLGISLKTLHNKLNRFKSAELGVGSREAPSSAPTPHSALALDGDAPLSKAEAGPRRDARWWR